MLTVELPQWLFSRGIKRDKLQGTSGAKFAVFRTFSLIFVDFRFSWKLQHCGSAEFSQKTAGNRRFSQETADFCRNPFVPFSLSLLIPPYLYLPLPHGLTPSETMVSAPSEHRSPRNKGCFGSGAPIFGFGLAYPCAQGVG